MIKCVIRVGLRRAVAVVAMSGWLGGLASAADSVGAAVAPGAAAATGPRLVADGVEHDFGRVRAGDVVRHAFAVSNPGDAVLEIREVKSSCACAAVSAWPKELEAGGAAVLPVEFHAVNYRGPVSESIVIRSNDPGQPALTLLIKADVWHPIDVVPPAARLEFEPASEAPATAVLQITNNLEAPLALSELRSSHSGIAGEIHEREAGRSFELRVRTVPPLGNGNVFGKFTLRTSAALMPVLEIPVFAVVQPAVVVRPTTLVLPHGRLAPSFTTNASVRSSWASRLQLTKPEVSHPGIVVSISETEPGRAFLLKVEARQGFRLAHGETVTLSIRSNHPQFPVIRVPIVQADAPGDDGPGAP